MGTPKVRILYTCKVHVLHVAAPRTCTVVGNSHIFVSLIDFYENGLIRKL